MPRMMLTMLRTTTTMLKMMLTSWIRCTRTSTPTPRTARKATMTTTTTTMMMTTSNELVTEERWID